MKELKSTKIEKRKLTQEKLKSIFCYDKITGIFTYKEKIGNKNEGSEVGDHGKYKRTFINYTRYSLHHLVILYIDGWLPSYENGDRIDHIDRNTHNNSYNNLNATNGTGNNKNATLSKDNTSGLGGVSKTKSGFRVLAQQNYKRVRLYQGPDFFEACCARLSFNNKNGFSKNHGRLNKLEKIKKENHDNLVDSWSEFGYHNLDRIENSLGVF